MWRHLFKARSIQPKPGNLRRSQAKRAGMQPAFSFSCGESIFVCQSNYPRRTKSWAAGMQPARSRLCGESTQHLCRFGQFQAPFGRSQRTLRLFSGLANCKGLLGLAFQGIFLPECNRQRVFREASMMWLLVDPSEYNGPPNQRLKLANGCQFASLTGSCRSLTRSLGGINESNERTEDRFLRARH